ncbi:cytochrome c oxidase assembly protein [Streptomyces glaucescens]|uniref:Cytochrome c oxidase assembly protein n=1 Tax=Streptomyces glaucescens TaxID=1907 RepID=A0A089WZ18_STRGA|nr:cytochrome c oxidase assembly protein [Streptomyces glaucescens]AIR96712.1 hypothetical protein SGLAU_03420 [Streptomyces glaucescens]
MTTGHPPPLGPQAALVCVLAGVAYTLAAGRLRRRGDGWPRRRDATFGTGLALLLWGWCGPLPGGPFTEHSARHLLVGMAAPVLLVLARPLTLTLRTLPPGGPRRTLLRVAHSRPAGWLLLPPLAAVLHIGGTWALYRTGLMSLTHHHPPLDVLVHLHMVAAGLLFGFAVCRLDPVRGPRSLPLRAGTLLLAGAAHAVLAKGLYAAGPPGTKFAAGDLHTGAQLMYYGGDAVELLLAAALAVQWYAATGRRYARAAARAGHGAGPRVQRPQA